jgi:ABC-2 type transport system ATP-binding protein
MTELAIDVRHVVKRYADHTAVRDLSLAVPRGTVYGLLGPNGAGKTTTIRMILDIIRPDAGTISLFGRPNGDPAILDRLGYLPEERGLYKKMQVRRVLRFLAELKGVPAREADRRIDLWLDRLSLRTDDKDWGEQKVDELSRGMQQKVQFIGTLLHDPDLVILDEPFSGSTRSTRRRSRTRRRAAAGGRTVIFSTHLMDNAERLCDSVCIISRGDKVLDGGVAEVKAAHGGRHVALGLDRGAMNGAGPAVDAVLADAALVARADDQNRFVEVELARGADPQQLLRRLVAAGAAITRFELVQPSLHQIFLEKVGATGVEAGMSGHG